MSFDPFRAYTQARIGLGNLAPAMPTKAWLLFAYHHACAVDAVRAPWQIEEHCQELKDQGYESVILTTQALNREDYLMKPQSGRRLSAPSKEQVKEMSKSAQSHSIVILISNGLSSHAIAHHLNSFLSVLMPKLKNENLAVTEPFFLAKNGRVALIDDIGHILKPSIGLTIIGERPGLSAPDSLAVYLSFRPKRGLTDAARNCISNIRPPFGLSYEAAAEQTVFLIKEALMRKLSGVGLKEEALSLYAKEQ